jgi:hypothetical protein
MAQKKLRQYVSPTPYRLSRSAMLHFIIDRQQDDERSRRHQQIFAAPSILLCSPAVCQRQIMRRHTDERMGGGSCFPH